MDREQIQQAIPHRPPFLWIDEVTHLDRESIRGRMFLDPELPVFQGHFPGHPVFPGVLQCEAALQAGAILISRIEEIPTGQIPVATRMNEVKFRHIVKPGETMEIEVVLNEHLANAYFMTGKISISGRVATRLEFACASAPAE
jgi:3-hydroxyacyl-[acyl-carrier-protein] dehydratase